MKYTDPVCGMKVDEKSPHKSQHNDRTVYFCSAACKTKFDRNPSQYAAKLDSR